MILFLVAKLTFRRCQTFNNSEIKLSSNQKHLGLTLDSKLSFNEHINDKIHQANKGVGLLRKLQIFLSRNSLLFINRS